MKSEEIKSRSESGAVPFEILLGITPFLTSIFLFLMVGLCCGSLALTSVDTLASTTGAITSINNKVNGPSDPLLMFINHPAGNDTDAKNYAINSLGFNPTTSFHVFCWNWVAGVASTIGVAAGVTSPTSPVPGTYKQIGVSFTTNGGLNWVTVERRFVLFNQLAVSSTVVDPTTTLVL